MNALGSILVLTVLVLIGGAVLQWRRGAPRIQVVLMLVLAAIVAANIALLVWPTGSGATLVAPAARPT